MKNLMTRALAIAMLTTSMSAFAMSEKPKAAKDTNPSKTDSDATVVIYVVDEPSTDQVDEPNTDQEEAQPDQNDDKSSKQKLIDHQDKQWLHNLQGIYGG